MKTLSVVGLVVLTVLGVMLFTRTQKQVAHVTPSAAPLTLLHSSNRLGNLEPCGCQVNPFGGIDREANAVSQIRAGHANVLFVDSGNLLNGGEVTLTADEKNTRAATIIDMLNESGLDFFAPGPLDYDLGVHTLRRLQKRARFPFLSTNVTMTSGGESALSPYAIVELGGVRYGLLSLSDPAKIQHPGIHVESPDASLKQWLPKVKKESDITIVLSQLEPNQHKALSKIHSVQIFVGSDKRFGSDRAILYNHGKSLLVDTQIQGYLLGRLDVDFLFPFKGFSSDEEVERNRAGLAAIQKSKPGSEWAKNFEATQLLARIPGGSEFKSELIRLDAERFGHPNKLSELKNRYYESIRKQALSE